MADVLVDQDVCAACGSDIRGGSLFCYNCGKAVASGTNEPKSDSAKEPVVEKIDVEQPLKSNKQARRRRVNETDKVAGGQLESAAAIQRRERKAAAKTIEVVWEQPSGVSKGFIVATAVVFVIALIIIYFAVYLK